MAIQLPACASPKVVAQHGIYLILSIRYRRTHYAYAMPADWRTIKLINLRLGNRFAIGPFLGCLVIIKICLPQRISPERQSEGVPQRGQNEKLWTTAWAIAGTVQFSSLQSSPLHKIHTHVQYVPQYTALDPSSCNSHNNDCYSYSTGPLFSAFRFQPPNSSCPF